jgi:hypothetical protein
MRRSAAGVKGPMEAGDDLAGKGVATPAVAAGEI